MFVLRESSTFDWVVKAQVPEGKKRVGMNFSATFNQLDQGVVDELLVDEDTRDPRKFLELALVSFEGFDVEDSDGNKITDNDERNEMIRKNSLFIEPLMIAYTAGAKGHKGKN